jgi:hypothetical protein
MQSIIKAMTFKYPVLRYTNKNVVLRAINVGKDAKSLAELDKVSSRPSLSLSCSIEHIADSSPSLSGPKNNRENKRTRRRNFAMTSATTPFY